MCGPTPEFAVQHYVLNATLAAGPGTSFCTGSRIPLLSTGGLGVGEVLLLSWQGDHLLRSLYCDLQPLGHSGEGSHYPLAPAGELARLGPHIVYAV